MASSASSSWHGGEWPFPSDMNASDRANDVEEQRREHEAVKLQVSVLGSPCHSNILDLSVTDWGEFKEQLEQCGILPSELHPHNFELDEGDIKTLEGQTLEIVDHHLWLLLDVIPAEIRPRRGLNELQEVKLRLGQPPQMRCRRVNASPVLYKINEESVTESMLSAIVNHRRIAPSPGKFHQGRAGIVDRTTGTESRSTLHRITAVWGEGGVGTGSELGPSLSSAEVLRLAAEEIGRSAAQVEPFIQKLQEQWYDTAESLYSITEDSWRRMGIPEFLFHVTRRKLGALCPSSDNSECLTGLTLRVGRPIYGICDPIQTNIQQCVSTLLVGQAGVGKSTILREMSRLLSDAFHHCVVVVDTTNELGGFGSVPHQALGTEDVTRLTVKARSQLFQVMLDAVQNHSARVVIVDELRDAMEVEAARTIANQGVVLLASVHASSLSQLAHNPTLNPLIGGVRSAMIGDQRMRETHCQSKYQEFLEGKPAFNTILEISEAGQWRVIDDVVHAVTELLNGREDGGHEVFSACRAQSPGEDFEFTADAPDADTGSTSNSTGSCIDVQRPGVSKVPARLMAKLRSGSTIMCCFDGGVTWHADGGANIGGGGSCLFRIHTDGKKGEHLKTFDETVFLENATVDLAEFSGLLAGVESVLRNWSDLSPEPGLLLVEGDRKAIIDDLQAALSSPCRFQFKADPALKELFDHIIDRLRELEKKGVEILARHRQRRFNKVADKLSRQARTARQGSFQHELVSRTAASKAQVRISDQEHSQDGDFCFLVLTFTQISHLDTALQSSEIRKQLDSQGASVQPDWANGARILTAAFTKQIASAKSTWLNRNQVVLLQSCEIELKTLLNTLPYNQRPREVPATRKIIVCSREEVDKLRGRAAAASTPEEVSRSKASHDFPFGEGCIFFTPQKPGGNRSAEVERCAKFLRVMLEDSDNTLTELPSIVKGTGWLTCSNPVKRVQNMFECQQRAINQSSDLEDLPPICRVHPFDWTLRPDIQAFESLAKRVLTPHFSSPAKWALEFCSYGNIAAFTKSSVLRVMDGIISECSHTVDMENPDLCILVHVNESVCGFSVLKSWSDFTRYNLVKFVMKLKSSIHQSLGGALQTVEHALMLRDIFYTQDSIKPHFNDGSSLHNAISDIRFRAPFRPEEVFRSRFPLITVVKHNGKWFSEDNRRLYCLKTGLSELQKVVVRIGERGYKFFNNFTTTNEGTSITLRRDRSRRNRINSPQESSEPTSDDSQSSYWSVDDRSHDDRDPPPVWHNTGSDISNQSASWRRSTGAVPGSSWTLSASHEGLIGAELPKDLPRLHEPPPVVQDSWADGSDPWAAAADGRARDRNEDLQSSKGGGKGGRQRADADSWGVGSVPCVSAQGHAQDRDEDSQNSKGGGKGGRQRADEDPWANGCDPWAAAASKGIGKRDRPRAAQEEPPPIRRDTKGASKGGRGKRGKHATRS